MYLLLLLHIQSCFSKFPSGLSTFFRPTDLRVLWNYWRTNTFHNATRNLQPLAFQPSWHKFTPYYAPPRETPFAAPVWANPRAAFVKPNHQANHVQSEHAVGAPPVLPKFFSLSRNQDSWKKSNIDLNLRDVLRPKVYILLTVSFTISPVSNTMNDMGNLPCFLRWSHDPKPPLWPPFPGKSASPKYSSAEYYVEWQRTRAGYYPP